MSTYSPDPHSPDQEVLPGCELRRQHVRAESCAAGRAGRQLGFAPGAVLFNEGSPSDSLFTIREGVVKLVRQLPNGHARIVGLLARGSLVGQPRLTTQAGRSSHSAIALTPVEVEHWPRERLERLRNEQPMDYIRVLEQLTEQMRLSEYWITALSTGPIRSRTARLLLFLSRIGRRIRPDEVDLLTCDEMGDALGVTAESVSRVLADMKRRHLLVRVAGRSAMRYRYDPEALAEIARQ